ncbi:hypothetical protein NP493_926g02040 [Ridgeia piscesae]|uniref:Methyltransferase type 11 domain-containing protein n=1 Tax=Ridgeia piscesae TaxID=27915 RepID=A0AAD9NJP5_RIDPI|nr:hypothetical protein NP493_926g02040 [Ridgeia piscesae]
MAGGLVSGHVKLEAFEELARITKPGGYVVVSLRDEVRQTVTEYTDLDRTFAAYVRRGMWEKVSETITENYYMGRDGVVFVFRVQ